ncbi:MAG TPA: glycosyltransferase family 2 protein [Gemmatimonadales bacterium]|nr:glycosyltransferase family 2 protein [Gemmatimonadales bacterium]
MIYVLVPAYNEAATVGLVLWKVRQVFTAFAREYQLLVVNDGSTDGTDDVLAPYARALPMTLITHRDRRGYARSVEELLRLAVARSDRPRRDLAVVLQADFSDSPDDVPELVRRIESGADLALADYRRRRGLPRREALARRLLPALLRRPKGDALDRPLDWVCSLKAVRLVTLARAISERGSRDLLRADGCWAADAELLLEVARHARRVEVVAAQAPAAPRLRPSRSRPLRSAWAAWTTARRRRAPAPRPHGAHPAAPPGGGRGPGRRGRRGGSRSAAAPSPRQASSP